MVKQLLICVSLFVFVLAPTAFGADEKTERDRKARVALALASPAVDASVQGASACFSTRSPICAIPNLC